MSLSTPSGLRVPPSTEQKGIIQLCHSYKNICLIHTFYFIIEGLRAILELEDGGKGEKATSSELHQNDMGRNHVSLWIWEDVRGQTRGL